MWLIIIGIISVYFMVKFYRHINYWKNRGVDSAGPWAMLKGLYKGIMRTRSFGDLVLEIYNSFPNSRYTGTFQFDKPLLMLRDLDTIKQLTIKDFDHFEDHNQMISEDMDPLWGKNLFALRGERWRDMRATLSPAFTTAKMKSMFMLINECGEEMVKYFYNKKQDVTTLEMKDTFTRFANDVIASTAFGIKCDSLAERENEFYMMGKEVSDFSGIKFFKMMVLMMFPMCRKLVGNTIFSKKVSSFFRKLVKDNMQLREKEGIIRPDMIHLLMEAQKGRLKYEESLTKENETGFATVQESHVGKVDAKKKRELSDDDLTAQAMIFFFAGFDSVSQLMSFTAYELAINPDIHDKLQAEVDEVYQQCNGKLTYESLSKMKYMDMVVSETLRKWPAAPAVDRVCTKSFTLEPKEATDPKIHLEEGDLIWLPIFGLHRDPKYFPDPEKFDPERFSDENKHNIRQFSYIPFGVGPRNCIGSRFALLEAKAVIFHLLTKFNIIVIKQTQIPLKLSTKQFNTAAENGIWLGLKRRHLM